MTTIKDIGLLIVFYKPEQSHIENARRLSELFNVTVVDNSAEALDDTKMPSSINYLPQKANKGIAEAQNIGIEAIVNKGLKVVLFLDQDSSVNTDIIEGLVSALNKACKNDPKTIAVGPLVIDKATGKKYKGNYSVKEFDKVQTIISSGTIARLDYLNEVGWMESALFIDNVDHEWCWRANSKGYSIYRANNILFPHKVGSKTYRIMGLQFLSASPIRYYYKYRNLFILTRRKYVPSNWKRKNLLKLLVLLFVLPFISEQTLLSYKYMFKGLYHGLTKKGF